MTKYNIEVTEEQLRILKKCCEIYFRLMMGQPSDFADEIVRSQIDISAQNPNHEDDFDHYLITRNHVEEVLNTIFRIVFNGYTHPTNKTEDVLVAQDLWDAFREIFFPSWKAIQLSRQPLPKITSIIENKEI